MPSELGDPLRPLIHAKKRRCEGDMFRPQSRLEIAMIRLVLIAITFLAVIGPGHSFKDQDFKVTLTHALLV